VHQKKHGQHFLFKKKTAMKLVDNVSFASKKRRDKMLLIVVSSERGL
jgi:16S rRNA A1518/A1519 N6-dimethyltransferase RsmA/KsgA/DIM1 with predicted DNA glycosylase/AP lyase activity